MAKTTKINLDYPSDPFKHDYTCNLKGVDKLIIYYDGVISADQFQKVSLFGSTLMTRFCGMYKYKFTNISSATTVEIRKSTGDKEIRYTWTFQEFFEHLAGDVDTWTYDDKKGTVTGSVFADNIDVSDYSQYRKGLKINANAGDDKITATAGDDNITGGSGQDTIIIKNEVFGTDTIVLTSKEGLTLDMTEYAGIFDSADDFKGQAKVVGNNLEIIVPNNGKLIIKDFAKTNITGNTETGYLKIKLAGDNFVNLNTDEVLEYGANAFSKNEKKQSATFSGSRLSETITVNADELENYVKTINTGAGTNTVNITSKGKVTINGGADADIISVIGNDKETIVKAGNGANEINISAGTGKATVTTGDNADNITVTNFGGATITSGKGDDTILAGDGNDTINAGDGADNIKAGAGNNKITGGKGNDTFTFSKANIGVDTITDAAKGDEIVITDVLRDDLRFAKNGNNLEIYYSADYDINNKIVIQNHFNAKQSNRIASLKDKNYNIIDLSAFTPSNVDAITGSGKINGTTSDDVILGSSKADTIKADSGNDTVYGFEGNDKLYGGAGNNRFIFKNGDGVDTIYSNGGNDTLQFNNFDSLDDLKAGVTLLSDGKSLKIKYSDNDIVVIDKFYTNKTNSVKGVSDKNGNTMSIAELITSLSPVIINGSGKVDGTNGDDSITSGSKADTVKALAGDDMIATGAGNDNIYGGKGNDTINAGTGKNNIYYSLGDGDDIIQYGGGTDTLVFDKGITVSATYSGKDLLVRYSGSKNGVAYDNVITVEDYKNNAGVKSVKIGNTTKSIDSIINSSRGEGEVFISTGESEEWVYWNGLKQGNHTFVYDLANADPEYNTFSYDLIASPNTAGSGYTDTFQFNNHAIQRHNNKQSVGIEFLKDTLHFKIWNDTTAFGGMAQYLDVTDNNANIVVKDADEVTYNLKAYKGARTIDNHNSKDNPITFIDSEIGSESYVIGNNKYNYTGMYRGNLTYTYNGGHDRVDTAEHADATYIINSFNTSTVMTIDEDGGANDTVNFKNTSADDIRPLFNVTSNGGKYYRSYDRLAFAHKDSDIAANLKATVDFGAVDVKGAIFIYDYNYDTGYNINNLQTLGISDIDEDAWYDAITQRVGNWLDTYGYYDVSDALWGNTEIAPDALAELYACYTDVVYSEVVTDSQIVPHDPGSRGAYTGTDGNDQFISTNGNDTFELFKGNDLVTFGENFGNDEITSESIAARGNTDTLKFTNYGFADEDNGLSSYIVEDLGNPGEYNLVIQTDDGENTVTYHNLLDANAPNVKIVDTTGTYYAEGYTGAQDIDHSADFKNHLDYIIADSGTSTVKTNSKYSLVHSEGGASLDYTFNGGQGTVVNKDAANDIYTVNSVSNSSLAIVDMGGSDTLNINDSNANDLRLFLEVYKDGNYDTTNIAIVNKNSMTAEALPRVYSGINVPGVHVFAYGTTDDEGIENVNINGEAVDTSAWYSAVAEKVSSWLSNTSYNSAGDAIAAYSDNPDSVDISGLVAAYTNVNMEYNMV